MERTSFPYSTRNIPCASKDNYLRRLIEKTETVIRNMRWRAFFYLNPITNVSEKETYGFKSRKTPPAIDEMRVFENRMTDLIQNIEFDNRNNEFQRQLQKDIRKINEDPNLIIKADKTTNFYKMSPDNYNDLVARNVQKTYKKSTSDQVNEINQEAKNLAEELDLEDRIDIMAQRESFITLKDHKPNFANNPTCRLINPCKSELGRASKLITEKIVKRVVEATQTNLWRNTNAVLEWFRNISNKRDSAFICFDIVEFYPSITEKLLNDALDFASEHVEITALDRRLILHAKQTLLYNQGEPWVKKDNLFDITMGSYDGAECCELTVVYLLSQLKNRYGNAVGLYRDDGLAVFNEPPRTIERIKKKICDIFKNNGLRITIEANKKVVNYLDVTMDLNQSSYRPYLKPDNTPLYVNAMSNHPPAVIRTIPKGINHRLSTISSNEDEFKTSTKVYQEALEKSGHNHTLEFKPDEENHRRSRTRKRNITWFNPPFDSGVKTNVGGQFLKIINESFPRGHILQKIFNKNTLKLSYSCMPNMKTVVDAHNKKVMNTQSPEPDTKPCNCRNKNQCPLGGKCRTSEIVYQATVTSENNTTETYIGLTENEFKLRFGNHQQSFRHDRYRTQTELSKHIWGLKDRGTNFEISWKILRHAKSYSNVAKRCSLCTMEKFFIICRSSMASLNKRTELISTCRHAAKHKLKNLQSSSAHSN